MTLVCSHCGEKNGDADTMCGMCGAVLKKVNEPVVQRNAPPPINRAPQPRAATPTPTPRRLPEQRVSLEYVGFWPRVAALLIDSLILCPFIAPIVVVLGFMDIIQSLLTSLFSGGQPKVSGYSILAFAASLCLSGIYSVIMHCSPLQATVGKLALGIKVSDLNGNRITVWAGIVRFLVRDAISPAIGMILMANGLFQLSNWTELIYAVLLVVSLVMSPLYQGMHDSAAGTVVVKKQPSR